MRNSVLLPNGFVLTTDNSAGIGEKEHDIVPAADDIVSYFAARVTLLEQWAALAYPSSIIVHNFSGTQSWDQYIAGIERLFQEIEVECPVITGSSETNMETMQSAMAVTMIGERQEERLDSYDWFIYGKPCVGNEVLEEAEKIANMKKIWNGINNGLVHRVWPVGSTGILEECHRLGLLGEVDGWDLRKSAGPATSVLLGIALDRKEEAKMHFGQYFETIK